MSQSVDPPPALCVLCCQSGWPLGAIAPPNWDDADITPCWLRKPFSNRSVGVSSRAITSSRAARAGLHGRSGSAKSFAGSGPEHLPRAVPSLARAVSALFRPLWGDSRSPLTGQPDCVRASSARPECPPGASPLNPEKGCSQILSLHPYLILSRELFSRKVSTSKRQNDRKWSGI